MKYTICVIVFLCSYLASSQDFVLDDMKRSLPCIEKNLNVRVIMTVDSMFRTPHLSHHEVDSIFNELNKYFEPICMSFTSCDYEVSPNYSYSKLKNVHRMTEMGVVFHYPRRLNVLFVQEAFGEPCGASIHAGFDSYSKARIFVELSCGDDPVTQLAHHMGHLLGLHPTNFDGFSELVDGSNCAVAGDRICDTPADPYGYVRDDSGVWKTTFTPQLEGYNRGCEFVWETLDDNGDFYKPNVSNIMSPYPCKCQFTYEQYLSMAAYYNAASVKNY